jgi:hypothetical protein
MPRQIRVKKRSKSPYKEEPATANGLCTDPQIEETQSVKLNFFRITNLFIRQPLRRQPMKRSIPNPKKTVNPSPAKKPENCNVFYFSQDLRSFFTPN